MGVPADSMYFPISAFFVHTDRRFSAISVRNVSSSKTALKFPAMYEPTRNLSYKLRDILTDISNKTTEQHLLQRAEPPSCLLDCEYLII